MCGVLTALAYCFNRLVDDHEGPAIRAILATLDDLLIEFAPVPPDGAIDGTVYNSVLACFFEVVLPVDPAERASVMPHLGPVARAFHLAHDLWRLDGGFGESTRAGDIPAH